jgi:hypothetical protein
MPWLRFDSPQNATSAERSRSARYLIDADPG